VDTGLAPASLQPSVSIDLYFGPLPGWLQPFFSPSATTPVLFTLRKGLFHNELEAAAQAQAGAPAEKDECVKVPGSVGQESEPWCSWRFCFAPTIRAHDVDCLLTASCTLFFAPGGCAHTAPHCRGARQVGHSHGTTSLLFLAACVPYLCADLHVLSCLQRVACAACTPGPTP
jgi:hypothetical protein